MLDTLASFVGTFFFWIGWQRYVEKWEIHFLLHMNLHNVGYVGEFWWKQILDYHNEMMKNRNFVLCYIRIFIMMNTLASCVDCVAAKDSHISCCKVFSYLSILRASLTEPVNPPGTEFFQRIYGFGPKVPQNGARIGGPARIEVRGPEKLERRPV
jgi:hypothetical protein